VTLRALDLFCGAGGATRGLQLAGFEVTGVDLQEQPRYVGDDFYLGDVLEADPAWIGSFDFVWASPPCQAHTALKGMHNALPHADLIGATRELLIEAAPPAWVIENVEGAPLRDPTLLCGTMFGLGARGAELRRHRLFETSWPVKAPACSHSLAPVIHVRDRRRPGGSQNVPRSDWSAEAGREAMGVDWMTLQELSLAIPPAYSEFIARSWLAARSASRQDGEYRFIRADEVEAWTGRGWEAVADMGDVHYHRVIMKGPEA
jgi:DNA (cytosine-5)-methyltransferase 1